MPCTYYTPQEEAAMHAAKSDNLKAELDQAVRLLCGACKVLEVEGVALSKVRGLSTWWKRHQKMDRERLAQEAAAREEERREAEKQRKTEQLRAKGLSKLSKAERKALGL